MARIRACASSGWSFHIASHSARLRIVGPGVFPCRTCACSDRNMSPVSRSQSQMPSVDPETASANCSSLLRSDSLAIFCSVMSVSEPVSSVGWPSEPVNTLPRERTHVTVPPGVITRYSTSNPPYPGARHALNASPMRLAVFRVEAAVRFQIGTRPDLDSSGTPKRSLARGETNSSSVIGFHSQRPSLEAPIARRVALLRKLEVGGALYDSHFKLVVGRAELLLAAAQRFLGPPPESSAPANSDACESERQKSGQVEEICDEWIIHGYQLRQSECGE